MSATSHDLQLTGSKNGTPLQGETNGLETHFVSIWHHLHDAVLICDSSLNVIHINPAFELLTGYSQKELIGQRVDFWQSGLMNEAFYQDISKALTQGEQWRGEIWLRRKDRSPFPALLTVCKEFQQHALPSYVAIFKDLTLQKDAEMRLQNRVDYDALTSLPNRIPFSQNLMRLCECQDHFALMVLDLRGMKAINTTHHHDTGDEILSAVAKRLLNRVGPDDFLARIGGDEFAILVPGIHNHEAAEQFAKQIMGCFDWPFQLSHQQMYITAAMGVALWPFHSHSPDALFSNAEHALFEAKKQHIPYKFFTAELRKNQQNRNQLQQDLINALKENQLFVVYQPIWNTELQCVTKLEALLRWKHPEKGFISPVEFIPIAEECGLIQMIGQWVLLQACADLNKLKAKGFLTIQVSINRSTPEFQTIGLDAKEWLNTIDDMGLKPQDIIFEVTESLLMANQSENRQRMKALKDAGCQLAIDDFGTGYSALSYLRSFPIDIVKIDKAFVSRIPDIQQECLLLDGMINMVRSLEMQLIIEGVEQTSQLEFLQSRNCHLIQGYLFSKPLPFDELVRYLEKNNRIRTVHQDPA